MTYSNQYANPSTVGLILYMGILYNFLVDLFIFNVTFTTLQLVGIAVCISFSVSAAVYKIRIQMRENEVNEQVKLSEIRQEGFDENDGQKEGARKSNDRYTDDDSYFRS